VPAGLPCAQLRLISHRLSAGFPSPAADHTKEALNLNDYLVRNKPATFMFTVKCDSPRSLKVSAHFASRVKATCS